MNYLVTGATGFVGRHLVRALAAEAGGPVSIHGTAYPDLPPASTAGLAPRASAASVALDVVLLDLRDREAVLRTVGRARPERVVHLAAVSNVRSSWEKREETMATNLLGTFNLLEALRMEAPAARILFVSSADVYGLVTVPDKRLSEADAVRAVNPYAYTKAAGEMMCDFYAQVEGLDIVVARPFPHTGPGQAADFVCSDWARQLVRIERGEAPSRIRVGNLDVRRDFSDVRDVVRAYAALLERGRKGEIYNVCSGVAVSLREILETLIREADLGTKAPVAVEIDPAKLRKADQALLLGDNAKIRRETGWAPALPLDLTLRDLLASWRN